MSDSEKKAEIPPVRLGPESIIRFECHKDVDCFTKCCRGIDIILTPYDVIRLKKRLDLSSQEFLAIYTQPHILEETDLPVVTLKLLEDEEDAEKDEKPCPFVREDGCIVYEDRPTACRYYPLGVGSLSHKEGADDDGFYFFIDEPHCLGFEEKKDWTVKEWRRDQGVDIHDDINAEWTDLLVRKRSFPKNVQLSEKAKELFFMAGYNIDKFREFVFESTFLDMYDIDAETLKKIKADDIELLRFGMRWLKSVFFKREGETDDLFGLNPEKASRRPEIKKEKKERQTD
ncbi:Zinc/iron-chelating domain-containing protein [Candidatus Desulfarcum epimagneticum]|uniref:Zinc/iron-chelating domain-containing protein n=1 Tax=uncultured Desulfobacteraceae bacterium TaxID=218296 RepID=A0A484HJP4_9BACT|nr:Zinc/iron-chelating domain-containing protein [uncultured Desulfobacteraceae bacterium]